MNEFKGLPKRRILLVYLLSWSVAAVALSLSSLSQYIEHGGDRYWEPILWEGSSVFMVALLAALVFRLVLFVSEQKLSRWQVAFCHVLGALFYVALHITGMYAIRFVVYAIEDVSYDPGPLSTLIVFESMKDLVTYAFLASISYGALYFLRERSRRHEIADLQRQVAAARLATLQSQLNPHFLFNTLNLISSVLRGDPDQADRILEQLATLLRATLEVGDHPTHPLRAELDILQPYLEIMGARFGERLKVELDIDAGLLRREVPTLILLPIVENAIQHGCFKHAGVSRIVISAQSVAGQIRFTVSNDTGVLEASSREGGIGLANSRERLWRLYGKDASIELHEHNPSGAEVTITLPAAIAKIAP